MKQILPWRHISGDVSGDVLNEKMYEYASKINSDLWYLSEFWQVVEQLENIENQQKQIIFYV